MIVAVVAMRMMQVTIDQVIDVVTMRHCFVAATLTMDVAGFMATALMRHASAGVCRIDIEPVLFDFSALLVMKVPVVQVIDMAAMLDRRMAALRTVLMRMILMLVLCHDQCSQKV